MITPLFYKLKSIYKLYFKLKLSDIALEVKKGISSKNGVTSVSKISDDLQTKF